MKKNNNKFLNTNIEKKTFDAFNVTSMLLFFGVLATFIVSLVDYSMIVSAAQDKAVHVYPLLLRCLAIVLTFVPLFLEKVCKIKMTFTVSTCIYLYLFIGLFLGTFNGLFDRLDILSYFLNAMSGFVLALFALIFVNHFFTKRGKEISPVLLAMFCICIAVCVSLCWESFEYLCDLVFETNMQKYQNKIGNGPLADTMTDLMSCLIGATTSGIMSACIYSKKAGYLNSFSIFKIRKGMKLSQGKPQQEVEDENIETIE